MEPHRLHARPVHLQPGQVVTLVFRKQLKTHFLQTVSPEELAKWFDPLTLRRSEKSVDVAFPHEFFAQWFLASYRDVFEKGVQDLLGAGYAVSYGRVMSNPGPSAGEPGSSFSGETGNPAASPFDAFFVNRKNYFPFASAREVAVSTEVLYTPFVLCGASGTGKSFLLSIMAAGMTERTGGRVLQTSIRELDRVFGERFTSPRLAEEYLGRFSVLLVDDFQDMKLFPDRYADLGAWLSRVIDAGRQLVIASRLKIACLDYLPAGLKSRLEGGLVVDLKKPDLDVRLRFLREECLARNVSLPQDKMVLLAQQFSDFRSLKGVVLKVFAFDKLVRPRDIGRELDRILAGLDDRPPLALSAEHILQTVAEHFDLSCADILSSSRKRQVASARQVAMFLCRENLRYSYPKLGRVFGGKDHTSVLYSCKKISALLKDDPEMKRLIGTLSRKCLAQTT